MQVLHGAPTVSTESMPHFLENCGDSDLLSSSSWGVPLGLAGNGHFGKNPQMTDGHWTDTVPERWKELETRARRSVEPDLGFLCAVGMCSSICHQPT